MRIWGYSKAPRPFALLETLTVGQFDAHHLFACRFDQNIYYSNLELSVSRLNSMRDGLKASKIRRSHEIWDKER